MALDDLKVTDLEIDATIKAAPPGTPLDATKTRGAQHRLLIKKMRDYMEGVAESLGTYEWVTPATVALTGYDADGGSLQFTAGTFRHTGTGAETTTHAISTSINSAAAGHRRIDLFCATPRTDTTVGYSLGAEPGEESPMGAPLLWPTLPAGSLLIGYVEVGDGTDAAAGDAWAKSLPGWGDPAKPFLKQDAAGFFFWGALDDTAAPEATVEPAVTSITYLSSPTSITLNFNYAQGGNGFMVDRKPYNGPTEQYVQIGTVAEGDGAGTYTDSGLTPLTFYDYRIRRNGTALITYTPVEHLNASTAEEGVGGNNPNWDDSETWNDADTWQE